MEPIQYGESSKSPARRSQSPRQTSGRPNGANAASGVSKGEEMNGISPSNQAGSSILIAKSRLILPQWDIPPANPLHPSHDLISLLSLASLYNTYVRPYAPGVEEESGPIGGGGDVDEDGDDRMGVRGGGGVRGRGGGGVGGQKGRKLDKGYIGLLDDCIDPMPNGASGPPSLVPLIHDLTDQPTGPPPEIWDGPIEILPAEKWDIARLEAMTQKGYTGGEKDGVRKAEEKRRRRREARAKALQPIPIPPVDTSDPNPLTPGLASTPGTPLLPVLPPSRGPNGFFHRRQESGSGRPPPINPAHVSSVPGTSPTTATFRPTGAAGRPITPGGAGLTGGVKRVYEGQGAGMSKKAKLAGTRSASPLPSSSLGKNGDGTPGQKQPGQQVQGKSQARPGFGKGSRARTEGM